MAREKQMLERSRLLARWHAAFAALGIALALGCANEPWPRPAAMPNEQFDAEFREWRDDRRSRLVAPGSGPVTWVGLWELPSGDAGLGADSTLPIVLPASDAPRVMGTLRRTGQVVRFEPAPHAKVQLGDSSNTPVTTGLTLESDRGDSATVLAVGSLRMRVHGEPGTDRLWLRAWDVDDPIRETFTLPETFAPDTLWRIAARFEPFKDPREYRVADIAGGTQAYRAPGKLVFHVGRKEYRLTPFADSASRDYFVMFWDSTAMTATYEAGRYLHVPFPDSTGWTVVDFNRSYNPPCVFTAYSTCALPLRENRLPLAVTAGEKRAR
jgi:uncharacterized protein